MRKILGAVLALAFAAGVAACTSSQVQTAAGYWAAAKVGVDAGKAKQAPDVVDKVNDGEALIDTVLADLAKGTSTKADLQAALHAVQAVVKDLPPGTLNDTEQGAVTALEAILAYEAAQAS